MKIRVIRSHTVEAKPYSVNLLATVYGKKLYMERYDEMQDWKKLFISYLPDEFLPRKMEDYSLRLDFYMDANMDLDNALKYTIDALQDKYEFNDRKILHLVAYKHKIPWDEAKRGIKERYRIKISLTEKLEYIEDNLDDEGEPTQGLALEYTTSNNDYRKFYELATQRK